MADGETPTPISAWFMLSLWCLLGVLGSSRASSDTYYMANWDHCLDKIDASVQGGRVKSQIHHNYAKEIDCVMTIDAIEGQQIYIQFEQFDIPDVSDGVCRDALYVYDGSTIRSNNSLVPEGGLCGSSLPDDIKSTSNSVTLRFKTNGKVWGTGYDFVFVAFMKSWVTHTCPRRGDFRCKNAMCIDPKLQCDGNNNCGDSTDESNNMYEANCPLPWTDIIGNILRLGNAAIVGLLAALVVLVVSMICLIACCCRKTRSCTGNSRQKRYIRYSQAVRGEIAGNTLEYQNERKKTRNKDSQSTLRSYTPAIMEGGFLGEEFLKGGRRQSREVYRPIREDSFPQLPTPSNTPVNVDSQQQRSLTPSDLQEANISAVLTSLEKEQRQQTTTDVECHDI
ncbi:uncharacterized protein [Ptychodera flava]|uniref:uncharacterized protein n=1 Tax=Ptychodera flava TaxID=63121 RepID=UPI003969D31C